MIRSGDYDKIQTQLVGYLKPVFDDVAVEVGDNIHYKGTNIVVTSKHFTGLLAEQRYHHVVRAIPEDLYNNQLRKGVVWFELTPEETGMDLMRMPRAVDVRDKRGAIEARLRDAGFFSTLTNHFKKSKETASVMRFDATRKILGDCNIAEDDIEEVCLYLIGSGAFCDAHVLKDVAPKFLAESAA